MLVAATPSRSEASPRRRSSSSWSRGFRPAPPCRWSMYVRTHNGW